jgi:hypothetical protein
MRRALEDPALLGAVLAGDSWRNWRTILIAANGEPLSDAEFEIFRKFTGRPEAPTKRCDELWCPIGRRGGKSQAMAVEAVYHGALCKHKLSRGERARVLLIAQDKQAAKISLDYIEGALDSTPMLRQLMKERKREEIELSNGVVIEVRAPTLRGVRGVTAVAIICDEISFWRSEESANPDQEILAALRPTLLTTRGPLFAISSPYARRGVLYDAYRRNYGPEGDPRILVAKGSSMDFNPSLPQAEIDRALARDPEANRAEYLAEFRSDVQSLVTQEAVEACTDSGVRERPFRREHAYVAFVDPSGGSSDAMTLGISHREGETVILDLLREHRPPFSPESVVAEYASVIKRYRCPMAYGDRYGSEWVVEQFRKNQVHYEHCEQTRSELYLNLVPLINSRAAALLDNDRLAHELATLERTATSVRDKVDHPRGMHDDLANAAAGALVMAHQGSGYSPAQRFQDTLKIEAYYKKQARSIA